MGSVHQLMKVLDGRLDNVQGSHFCRFSSPSTFSFKKSLPQKNTHVIPSNKARVWLTAGEWEQNYYMSTSPLHISCVISRKSPLIVLYCELKQKKRDPRWKAGVSLAGLGDCSISQQTLLKLILIHKHLIETDIHEDMPRSKTEHLSKIFHINFTSN